MPSITELCESYEAHFGGPPFKAANPAARELWSEFGASLDIDLRMLMARVAQLRGKRLGRPSLVELQEAAGAIRSDMGIQRHAAQACGFCVHGQVEVLYWVNEYGRPIMGHTDNGARLYWTAVPCQCKAGAEIAARENVPADLIARAMDARRAIMADAQAIGLNEERYIRGILVESVRMYGPHAGVMVAMKGGVQ